MKAIFRKSVFGLVVSFLSVSLVIAQSSTCPDLVNQALESVNQNCIALARNQVCYGYNQVEASFQFDVADDYFTQEADISPIEEIATLHTTPLNTETGTWGVAMMSLQADLPNTIPGQNVTFVLLGDVTVENAVPSASAFVPSDGIEVTVNADNGANVRSGAGQHYNVIGGLRDGTVVLANGLSPDGQWLRINYRERPAWVSLSVIDDNHPALRDLPTLTDGLRTPMQAFYLRTGIGQPECEEAPSDSLFVQGPDNIEINLTVNGADIRLGSSGVLRTIEEDGEYFLEIAVFDGEFEVGDVVIRRGQRSKLCLGNIDSEATSDDLLVTCAPSEPEPFNGDSWCNLERFPTALLNYELDVPCVGETSTAISSENPSSASQSQVSSVNCNAFALVAPLSPVDAGTHRFEWAAASGENITYQLVFYNYSGAEVESFWTNDTAHSVNLGAETSTGGSFYWEVRAYVNSSNGLDYACVTFRSPALTRTADADIVVASNNFTASKSCTSTSTTATITWNGAPSDTVTINYDDPTGIPYTVAGSGSSGSMVVSVTTVSGPVMNIVLSSGGESLNLGTCP